MTRASPAPTSSPPRTRPVRSVGSPLRRYRLARVLIPATLVLYVFLALLWRQLGMPGEIYPFFAWTLFSQTPDRHVTERAVLAHAIDGEPLAEPRYLIPARSADDWKVLERTVIACDGGEAACDRAVHRWLAPVVQRRAGSERVDFSIVRVRIDLHEVRREIGALAAGDVAKDAFYEIESVVGRWTVGE